MIHKFRILSLLTIFACLITSAGCRKSQDKIPETKILTSWLTESILFQEFPEYLLEKNNYTPDDSVFAKLNALAREFDVLIFMGTYCPDSKREVPRFLKINDLLTRTKFQYKMYGLNRKKDDTSGMREKYLIDFIPTFIVYFQGEEIGRIVESPTVSIESDLYDICGSIE